MSRLKQRFTVCLAFVCFAVIGPSKSQSQGTPANCGILSVFALAQLTDKSIACEAAEHLIKDNAQATMTLHDVKRIASSLNMNVLGVKARLDELLNIQRPAIIHLGAPDHFTLLLDGSKDSVRLLEDPSKPIVALPRGEVDKRFDGYALVIKEDAPADSPHVRFEDSDYSFGILGVGQRVAYDYGFTNTGKKDLVASLSGST